MSPGAPREGDLSARATGAGTREARTELLGGGAITQRRGTDPTWVRASPAWLAVAAVGLAVTDWGSTLAGGSVVPGGPLDETAHLLTTVLVLWALGPRACERFLVPALVAAVAIDTDHVPAELGATWLTAGTPRPYPHSLLTVVAVLSAALVSRRHRDLLLGVALGVALHLWRDTSETGSGVSLFWPLSYRSVHVSHAGYRAVMSLVVTAAACRLRTEQR